MKRLDIMQAGGAALASAPALSAPALADQVLVDQVLAHPALPNQMPPNPARSRPALVQPVQNRVPQFVPRASSTNPAPIWTMATITRNHVARLARHAGDGSAARLLVRRGRYGGAAGLLAPDASRCMRDLPLVPRAAVAAITAHRRDLTGRMPGLAQFWGICRA